MPAEHVTFSMKVASGNAAIVEDPRQAISELIREVAGKVSNHETGGNVRDMNGNRVGTWNLDIEEPEDEDEDEDYDEDEYDDEAEEEDDARACS